MRVLKSLLLRLKNASGKHGYTCDGCGDEVFDYPQRRLCRTCERRLERNDKIVCPKCGRKGVSNGVCTNCKSDLPLFTQGISPFVYRAETASLVNRIKNGDRRLALYFGEQMTAAFLRVADGNTDIGEELLIVPVPLTDDKRKERGYNQAEELADTVANNLRGQGVSVCLDFGVLEKKREARQQKHLGITARKENASGAYHLHKRKACVGKTVLLIDDILTTGATGSACARLLLNAGAKGVVLLTIASLPERK
ncbi:MAG: ComF family protein [Clostridia bacterium]|nr:ComF family protein [Clostridia bacterium]